MPKERGPAAVSDALARDWLLALLRYAVTREEADRSAVLVLAEAMDLSGTARKQQSPFEFFRRSSVDLCRAIADDADPRRAAIIRRYLKLIDDQRLRNALEAAVELSDDEKPQESGARKRARNRPRELWKGLS
jgi:hypothetical protein